MITINSWLFLGLLLFAILPAYAFTLYTLHLTRRTLDSLTKIMENNIKSTLSKWIQPGNVHYLEEEELRKILDKRDLVTKQEIKQPGTYL